MQGIIDLFCFLVLVAILLVLALATLVFWSIGSVLAIVPGGILLWILWSIRKIQMEG